MYIYIYIYIYIVFGHLAVCITAIISEVVCLIAFNTFIVYLFFFIYKRWLFEPLSYETCCGLSACK